MSPDSPAKKFPSFCQSGFGIFFTPVLLDSSELRIRGIGIREWMLPSMIERPRGAGDYLFMLFHDPASMSDRSDDDQMRPPQTMMIWPPGRGQFYGNRSFRFCHSWIHCQGSRIRQMIQKGRMPLLQPLPVSNPLHFEQGLQEIHGELVSQSRPDPVIAGNILEKSLRQLLRLPDPSTMGKIPRRLAEVHQLLLTGPSWKITLDNLAEMVGISAPYFCSLFTKTFHISPMECLVKHRMYRASRLLIESDLRISEIARDTGYEDPFHFSKTFRKYFGTNPRLFRSRGTLE